MRERGRRTAGGVDEFIGDAAPGREEVVEEQAAPPGPPSPATGELPPIGALVPKRDELPTPYARIVRRLFTLDVEDAFEKVTAGLQKGKTPAHRQEYGDIVDDLDEASGLQLLAHQLAANAAVTVARYEADLEVLRADMRAQAVAALNKEREHATPEKGAKPKQVTDADVIARMASSYPGEYRRLETLLAEAKAAKKFVDSLPDQWAARVRALDGRVRTVRKG